MSLKACAVRLQLRRQVLEERGLRACTHMSAASQCTVIDHGPVGSHTSVFPVSASHLHTTVCLIPIREQQA